MHQVFLPPATLSPFPLPIRGPNKRIIELTFHTLPVVTNASQGYSQSQSLRHRLTRNNTSWIDFSQAGLKSLERSTVLGKRSERVEGGEREDDATTERQTDETQEVENGAAEPGLDKKHGGQVTEVVAEDHEEKRVSKRVTRQSVSLLHDLPQVYPSAPVVHTQPEDSFSTTTSSFPSQLLTNPGNTSVSNLPRWSIPLHKLTSLATLLAPTRNTGRNVTSSRSNKLHTLIVCVLSAEPVVQRQRKEEKAKGKEGSLFIGKWTVTAQPLSGEEEVTTTVRLWDECAKEWGERVKRGDVVLLENIELKPFTSKEPTHLSISPHHIPKITILYRTLPRYETSRNDYIYRPAPQADAAQKGRMILEDKMLRPDLRLGRSEAGIRKVEGIARWFAGFVAGEAPA
ncbi:uncharacterized protein I303_106052 [Kwoniella dejecticola CBS 10117]|uniref:Uncharacterized protein n=1 Tax=Kwoniella dejecticola CBS 10117 TaxID=1296121 RepID=A0A1A6A152_9TREE|nr:uncharacterized protein I303_06072 [Kwoniella dejecticola CBS 10117]OBR83789.1 hypothetical protein I303_06072 [Kwoniella dejecticola CBS 10117]